MKAVAFSPMAEADLGSIWDYSAERWGPDQADSYTDAIRDACQALAGGERQGRAVNIRPGYLKYAVGTHMVYFREQADQLEIIRILHQRQDVIRNL